MAIGSGNDNGASLGFEQKLVQAANKLRNNIDAAAYKHVALGLILLKYSSDVFDEKHASLETKRKSGADPNDPDENRAENIFWVPKGARWSLLQGKAKQPSIGKLVDDATVAIERDNPSLKGVLPKDYARPALDEQRLGELIDLVGTIGLGDLSTARATSSGGSTNTSSRNSPPRRARRAASSTRPNAWSTCSSRAAFTLMTWQLLPFVSRPVRSHRVLSRFISDFFLVSLYTTDH